MQELRRIEQDILARSKIDSDHLEALRRALYAGGTVGRPAADFQHPAGTRGAVLIIGAENTPLAPS